jgi:hypothetical protein
MEDDGLDRKPEKEPINERAASFRYLIYCGSGTGSDFGKVSVLVPIPASVLAPDPAPVPDSDNI